jgi:hypothetical protein
LKEIRIIKLKKIEIQKMMKKEWTRICENYMCIIKKNTT